MSKVECRECGNDLNVRVPDDFEKDWVKVVCSNCGVISNVSVVRLAATSEQTT